MDRYIHKTMGGIVSLEKKIDIRSQEFMVSKVRLNFEKKIEKKIFKGL